MTVTELIDKLKDMPQDVEVWCENDDVSFLPDEVCFDEFKTVVIRQS